MSDPLIQDSGIVKIHSVCVGMNCVWRPTASHDIGVDGQLEFLIPGTYESTGDILAVQCKSGESYFQKRDGDCILFYPEPRHRRYWKSLRTPVVLVLHNPLTDLTLYEAVTPQLSGPSRPIRVSQLNRLNVTSRTDLIRISSEQLTAIDEAALLKFSNIKLERGQDRTITGIDFLLATTNRKPAYFELRMCWIMALFSLVTDSGGISLGSSDYEFVLRNSLQVQSAQVTEDFADDFDSVWFNLELVPDITVPLTHRGKALLEFLWNNLEQFLNVHTYEHFGQNDPYRVATRIGALAQHESSRLLRIA